MRGRLAAGGASVCAAQADRAGKPHPIRGNISLALEQQTLVLKRKAMGRLPVELADMMGLN